MTLEYRHMFTIRVAEILGSPTEAEDWLRRPAEAFDGQRPIDLLGTPETRQRLDDYFKTIGHGEGLLPEHGELTDPQWVAQGNVSAVVVVALRGAWPAKRVGPARPARRRGRG